ncbi:MAG: hypothetical protein RMX35_32465 [Nostoc sp. DcaGUA01]|nr:hypothetical protein [Nostoc sp. DcaGUA01]
MNKVLVTIAFGITAVAYLLYKINQKEQKLQPVTPREEPRQSVSNYPIPQVQRITEHYLVLVTSASQTYFLESLEAKIKNRQRIDVSDGEELYKVTQYLWLGYKPELLETKSGIDQYSVSKGEESGYDIRLVYIKLKQPDQGFHPNMNQLDRYDAFRKLAYLAESFEISTRLTIKASKVLKFYPVAA